MQPPAMPPQKKEPLFNFVEAEPAYLVGSLIAVHLALMVMPHAFQYFVAKYAILHVWGRAGLEAYAQLPSLVFHGFLHGSWMHLISNSFIIIVFGIAVMRGSYLLSLERKRPRSGRSAFFSLFFAGVVIGGMSQWLYWALSAAPLGQAAPSALGASGGASALFAAGGWALGGRPQMFKFAFAWLLVNLLMVVAENFIGIKIAWAAHLGGFAIGMLIAPFIVKPNSTALKVTK